MRSFCAASLLFAGAIGVTSTPAEAAMEGPLQTPAEQSHCLAVAHRFNSLNAGLVEKITQFNQVFSAPDENQKQILAGITKLATSTRQIADALKSVYGDAPTPSADEESLLAGRSVQDLIPDVKKCLS
jgi:hypothetical protein